MKKALTLISLPMSLLAHQSDSHHMWHNQDLILLFVLAGLVFGFFTYRKVFNKK